MIEAFSYGGGVQSVFMLVLIKEGVLPKPDLIGIANTGRECSSTWSYLLNYAQPFISELGLCIEVIPHSMSNADLYDKSGLTLIPAYVQTEKEFDGLWGRETETTEGRLSAFCSGEWKRDVMERWLRSKGVDKCNSWIGYSTDEAHRVKPDHRQWCHLRFPLIEKGISRAMCERIINAAGLPIPRKSRCWMCPHQTAKEWLEIKNNPEEWKAAIDLEKEINRNDPEQRNNMFLWSGRIPLELADFANDADVATPSRPCETASCWT